MFYESSEPKPQGAEKPQDSAARADEKATAAKPAAKTEESQSFLTRPQALLGRRSVANMCLSTEFYILTHPGASGLLRAQVILLAILDLLLTASYVFLLVVGARFLHSPCEHHLAIWCLVMGVLCLVAVIFREVGDKDSCSKDPAKCSTLISIFQSLTLLLVLAVFAWLVTGSVWTYPKRLEKCPHFLYWFCFFYIAVYWVVFLTIWMLICTCCSNRELDTLLEARAHSLPDEEA